MDKEIFVYNNVEFYAEDGVILGMHNHSNSTVDISIPKEFPQGYILENIPPYFADGSFGKIILDDDILSVSSYAFSGSLIEEVVWSKGCREIPSNCFDHSRIREITNIDNVEEIGEYAFSCSGLEKMVWPDNCSTISKGCFINSEIKDIQNIEHVTDIGFGAFAHSKIESLLWPSRCHKIPKFCFSNSNLEEISNIEHVGLIRGLAFNMCKKLRHIDLSNAICIIECNAFNGVDPDKIELPYYSNSKILLEQE